MTPAMTTISVRASERTRASRPKATAQAKPTVFIATISIRLLSGEGFSNGWAELALKKPPPLVPNCLIASWLATGPRAMVCLTPSMVWASTRPSRVCGTPRAMKATATTIDSGSST